MNERVVGQARRVSMKIKLFSAVFLSMAVTFAACSQGGLGLSAKDMAPPSKVVEIPARGDGPIRIGIGGDLMLDDLALPWILKYGYDYPLAGMVDTLKTFDAVVANLEVPVTSDCKSSMKHYSYSMSPDGLGALTRANIRAVSLSNNHVLDCGDDSAGEEMKLLDQAGIAFFGAGNSREEAMRGLILNVNGTKVGLIGIDGTRKAALTFPNTNVLGEDTLKAGIARMKKEADIVVVVPHWGDNYKPIKKTQEKFGPIAINLGADAVIGHHPHVWQPVSVYKGKPIVYSVGNFAFGTGNTAAKNSMIAVMEIDRKKIGAIRLIPLFNQNRNPEVAWQPRILTGGEAKSFLTKLVEGSKKYDATVKIDGDTGLLKL
jgi:hypothetical protein